MPKNPADVLIGISEVGHVTDPYGTPADVSWGATMKNGFSVAVDGENVDIESGQSKVLEETFNHAARITVTSRLLYTNLINVARALGLDDADVTGDLGAVTPTQETLEPVQTAIGEREFYLYAITPGPAGTRRFEFKRCKVRVGFAAELAANAEQRLEITFVVLRPKEATHEDKPFKIVDSV